MEKRKCKRLRGNLPVLSGAIVPDRAGHVNENQAEGQSAPTPAAQIRESTMRGVGIGAQRDATVTGDNDMITLNGDVRNLRVEGEGNTVTVLGSGKGLTIDSEGNS